MVETVKQPKTRKYRKNPLSEAKIGPLAIYKIKCFVPLAALGGNPAAAVASSVQQARVPNGGGNTNDLGHSPEEGAYDLGKPQGPTAEHAFNASHVYDLEAPDAYEDMAPNAYDLGAPNADGGGVYDLGAPNTDGGGVYDQGDYDL